MKKQKKGLCHSVMARPFSILENGQTQLFV